jgi:hypothetical protein
MVHQVLHRVSARYGSDTNRHDERLFASQYSAVTDMRRQVLAFLTKESYLDETAPIDWQILSWFPPVSRPVHELS